VGTVAQIELVSDAVDDDRPESKCCPEGWGRVGGSGVAGDHGGVAQTMGDHGLCEQPRDTAAAMRRAHVEAADAQRTGNVGARTDAADADDAPDTEAVSITSPGPSNRSLPSATARRALPRS